jgi:hypothetical protein
MTTGLALLGLFTSVLYGIYYGAVVATGIVVLRYARHTRREMEVRTSADQYPSIRAWCISLIIVTTFVMWVWPFQYLSYLWYLLHLTNLELALSTLILALFKPAVALVTVLAGVRLYERSRPIITTARSHN